MLSAEPPLLVEGDIVDKISDLVAQAPPGSNVVVFHSAVLANLTPEHRAEFADLMLGMPNVTWISNEGQHVLPSVAEKVSPEVRGRTILAVNGEPIALVGPHGQSFHSL